MALADKCAAPQSHDEGIGVVHPCNAQFGESCGLAFRPGGDSNLTSENAHATASQSAQPLLAAPGRNGADPRLPTTMNVPSDHESSRRYGFNLPWRGVVTGAVFYAGLSVFTIHLAKDFAGIMFVVLITLSAIFVLLAIIMVARRLVFPRVLELSEDAVLFPHGFPRTRITPIRYADVIQMSWTQTGLEMVTPRGHFEITASHFKEKEGYRAAADFVCRKTAIAMPPQREPEMFDRRRRAFPEPLLNWDEPRELSAYRTRLVVSSPLVPRLAKALWFFVRCLGFFILPWLLLQLFQLPTISTGGFLCVAQKAKTSPVASRGRSRVRRTTKAISSPSAQRKWWRFRA
jgi:hypothetical protein